MASLTQFQPKNSIWTFSNMLSILRILLITPAVWLLSLGEEYWLHAVSVFLIMFLTDFLDGNIARKRRETTQWGRILDPLADKLAIGSGAVALVFLRELPVWIASVIIARDIVIIILSILLIKKKSLFSPDIWGKATTFCLALLFLVYITYIDFLKSPLLIITTVLIVISSLSYGTKFTRFILH